MYGESRASGVGIPTYLQEYEIRDAISLNIKLVYYGVDLSSFLPLSPLGVALPQHR